MKVLLAAASPEVRATCKAYLESSSEHQYAITDAETVEQLYALHRQIQPQCILLNYPFTDSPTPDFMRQLTQEISGGKCAIVLLVEAEKINAIANELRQLAPSFLCADYLDAW